MFINIYQVQVLHYIYRTLVIFVYCTIFYTVPGCSEINVPGTVILHVK